MIDKHSDNPKSIKFYIKKYLSLKKGELNGKVVVDIPAGNGVTTNLLLNIGAKVEAFDLFPEYFMVNNHECKRADINQGIPLENSHADMVICQEGIEHFSDQLNAFKEFNRILKLNGKLVITTPSYSNLAGRFNYLLFERETSKKMPPNEIDDIWMSDKLKSSEIYHGHIFLVGLQKLRVLGKLAGFKVDEIKYLRLSKGSLILFPFLYPLIFVSSYLSYYRNLRKNKSIAAESKKEVYKEQLMINLNPKHLLNHHTFIVFEKQMELGKINSHFNSLHRPFDKMM